MFFFSYILYTLWHDFSLIMYNCSGLFPPEVRWVMPKAYMTQELPELSIQSESFRSVCEGWSCHPYFLYNRNLFVLFVRDGLAIPTRKAGGRDTMHGPHKQCGQVGL